MNQPENTTLNSKSELRKADKTKSSILRSTIAILGELGIAELSFENVALKSGVTRQLVRKYFPEKQMLIKEIAPLIRLEYQTFVIDRISLASNSLRMFDAYIESSLEWPRARPHEARAWFVFWHYCALFPEYKNLNSEFVKLGLTRLTQIIQICIQNQLCKCTHPEFAAKVVHGYLTGCILAGNTENPQKTLQEESDFIVEECRKLIAAPYKTESGIKK
jgi:AcrR family transcriptional regulator